MSSSRVFIKHIFNEKSFNSENIKCTHYKKKVITILKTEALLLFNYLTSDLEYLITKLGYKKEINFYPLNFG